MIKMKSERELLFFVDISGRILHLQKKHININKMNKRKIPIMFMAFKILLESIKG